MNIDPKLPTGSKELNQPGWLHRMMGTVELCQKHAVFPARGEVNNVASTSDEVELAIKHRCKELDELFKNSGIPKDAAKVEGGNVSLKRAHAVSFRVLV